MAPAGKATVAKQKRSAKTRLVEVRLPASTSNLGAGFDCFGLALQLYLTVRATVDVKSKVKCRVHIRGGKHNASLPRNAENLIYRSMAYVATREALALPPLHLAVHNEIPVSRGLGSSAAAIVAGIKLFRAALRFRAAERQGFAVRDRIRKPRGQRRGYFAGRLRRHLQLPRRHHCRQAIMAGGHQGDCRLSRIASGNKTGARGAASCDQSRRWCLQFAARGFVQCGPVRAPLRSSVGSNAGSIASGEAIDVDAGLGRGTGDTADAGIARSCFEWRRSERARAGAGSLRSDRGNDRAMFQATRHRRDGAAVGD